MLVKKAIKVEELVKGWDRNGDGDISKPEFRIAIRNLGLDIDGKEVDALFESLDADKGGSLDLRECRLALKKWQRDASDADGRGASVKRHATQLRQMASELQEAAEVTRVYEAEEEILKQMRGHVPIASRLGSTLKGRGVKIGDLVRSWDDDGNGVIDMVEFRGHVLGLGFRAEPAEVDELFLSLDDDGSGELDLEELKAALKKLQDAAADAALAEVAQVKKVSASKKAAKAVQRTAQQKHADLEMAEAAIVEAAREKEKQAEEEKRAKQVEKQKADAERKARRTSTYISQNSSKDVLATSGADADGEECERERERAPCTLSDKA